VCKACLLNDIPRLAGSWYKQARIGPVFCRDTSMALSQRLEVRQSQALVMTPQLMQAIKLLQLSSLDLAAYVDGELERNPLLERAGEDEAASGGDTQAPLPDRDVNS